MRENGFDLSTASGVIRKVARRKGIRSGYWIPVNAGTAIADLEDEAIVAQVWNQRGHLDIRAGDVRYVQAYG